MKLAIVLALSIVTLAAPSFAQSTPTEHGYIGGIGGFAVSTASTSSRVTTGDWVFEGGERVLPSLVVIGDIGYFTDLTPSTLQPQVGNAVSTLSSADAVTVVGTARMPAQYALGGLRWEAHESHHIAPFVSGGLGFARLMPTAVFTYTSGPLPSANPAAPAPTPGEDVTPQVSALGLYTPVPASTAFMFQVAGGADFPVAAHWAIDAQYRVSRISAATPLHAQGLAFGFGYRF